MKVQRQPTSKHHLEVASKFLFETHTGEAFSKIDWVWEEDEYFAIYNTACTHCVHSCLLWVTNCFSYTLLLWL
jgi:hypothetical protein